MSIYSILLFSLLSFLTGASAAGQNVTAELFFAGDAMQHQGQLDQALKVGGGKEYDYSDCFRLIAPEVTKADYAVVNLEVPLGGGPTYSGYPCFSAPDSYAQALKDAGFDLMLTANNHCLDRGDKGAQRTIEALANLGLDQIGTYKDTTDRNARVPFIKEIKGIKFGFLNYTYGTNGIEPKAGTEVALIDRAKMEREIKATREAGAEILVVAIHWGVEYVLRENANQRDIADFLVDQGVDLVIGGHPHVIQPMEVRHNEKEDKNVLVVYSLGNLISNMKTPDTRGGAWVRVLIDRGEDGKARFKQADYDTFLSAKPEGLPNYMVVPGKEAWRLPASQRGHWELFNRQATKIFDTYNKGIKRQE